MPEPEVSAEVRAGRLKERVYITFAALAVVLALESHDETAVDAALTLVISVLGTLLAVFVADVVSHVAVHRIFPDRRGIRAMAQMSFGALGAVTLPFLFVGLAVAGVWHVEVALRASWIALIVALVAIGFLSVRRVHLPVWQRLLVLFAEFALGALVIGLELVTHR